MTKYVGNVYDKGEVTTDCFIQICGANGCVVDACFIVF